MVNNQMRKAAIRILTIGFLLLSMIFTGFAQTNDEQLSVSIDSLKEQEAENDSFRTVRLESQSFDDDEDFIIEIDSVFNVEYENYNKQADIETQYYTESVERSTTNFESMIVERENGFYETVDYTYSTTDQEIKLKSNPSLTFNDILQVEKTFNSYNNRPEIIIKFTKSGADKFHLLTKENIGKPIAIVIEKHIVSMPIVTSEISGGRASISGDFSINEIDEMIEKFKNK